jgi:hypothetical protein
MLALWQSRTGDMEHPVILYEFVQYPEYFVVYVSIGLEEEQIDSVLGPLYRIHNSGCKLILRLRILPYIPVIVLNKSCIIRH